MFKIMVLFLLSLHFCLYSEVYTNQGTTYWNDVVRSYVHNSELQRRWAWSFLAPYLKELRADAQVLDIGCGDGKITADIAKFVPEGFVVGIDSSLSMLEWAQRQYHPLEYPNLSFRTGHFSDLNVANQFDLVISCCAFHFCSDQKAALEEISRVLKPNGKLLILVPAIRNSTWNQARATLQTTQKWTSYKQDIPSRQSNTIQYYTDLLISAGFQINKIENVSTMDPFIGREEILDWLTPPGLSKNEDRAFYSALIEEYVRIDPSSMDSKGTIYAKFGYITIDAFLNAQNK